MKSSRLRNHFIILSLFVFIFINALPTFAGPGKTTYQAKIVKPDGYPLEVSSVNFKFTILDPAGSCILYAETYSSVNMSGTGGLISFALGSGVKTYPASATTFEQVFSNITPSLSCDTGGPVSYSPAASDIRKIVMQFHDGSGWQTLPAMSINAVPYAMYANEATKLNGLTSSDFVQLSTVPTCATSEALRYTGAGFTCVAVGNSVTSSTVVTALGYTPADSVSLTTVTSNISSVSSTVFSVSSTVTSLQNSVAASFSAITSSQWTTSGTNIFYNTGNIGIGTTTPVTKLDVSGGVRIGAESTTCAPALAGTLRYNASNVEYCNGTSWQAFGVSGAGITNINGSTSGTQSFTTGTGGTAPNINTLNGVHTLNLPLANTGSVTAGLISNSDYTTFTNKITSSAASIAQVLGYIPADNAASGTYAQKANNLSDLTNVATARSNLGLGTFATASSVDLSSASATGIIADARLQTQTNVTSGTQYTKVTVDGKGRVTSGALLSSSDVTTALGYTPSNAASAGITTLNGSSSATQTFSIGTSGNSPAFNTAAGTHTLNIPLANTGSVTAGLLSNTDYLTFTNKQNATSAAIIATLGYTPANATSATQWTTNGSNIYYNTGNIGVGIINPSAKLELASGTALAAPLKFTSGTLLSSAQSGTMEYDGFNFYLTDSTNTRRTIATGSSAGSIDNASTINSTGNISMVPVGSVIVSSTTASTNSNTGALVVIGGLGVAGNVNTAGNLNVSGSSVIDGSLKLSTMTSGSMLFAGANGVVTQDNSSLFWDGANKRLGIGSNSPAQTLSVSGTSYFSGNVGVGTTNPESVLSLGTLGISGGFYGLQIGKLNASSGFRFGEDNSNYADLVWMDLGNYINFRTKSAGITYDNNLVLKDGNVGIGTASPLSKLDVNGAIYASGFTIFNHLYSNSNELYFNAIKGPAINKSTPGLASAPSYTFVPARDSGLFQPLAGTVAFSTSGLERLRIDTDGNVGIGTTTPNAKLNVKGTGTTAATSSLNITDSASSSKLFVRDDGNVGIGTSVPTTQLALENNYNGDTLASVTNNYGSSGTLTRSGYVMTNVGSGYGAYSAGMMLGGVSHPTMGNQLVIFANSGITSGINLSTSTIQFSTAAVERMRISPDGNVGIGTTTPVGKLDVAGNINLRVASNGGGTGEYIRNTFDLNSVFGIALFAGGSEQMRISSTGNVGVGTSTPTSKLTVAGEIQQTACGAGKVLVYNNFCYDNADRAAAPIGSAQITCLQAGGHLCDEGELNAVCTSLGMAAISSGTWINNSSSADDMFKAANNIACDNLDGPAIGRGNSRAFRCCYGVH